MTDLSPAAQTVLDAYWDDAPLESGARCGLASALRAAALYCKRDRLQLLSIAGELEGCFIPEDRYSRPCGGKGGFDDFVERWHE